MTPLYLLWLSVLALFLMCLAPPPTPAQPPEVRWRYDYNAARREAAERGMPLLLDFGAERCVWCDKLDATTFRDPALVALLNEQVVPLKIDGNRDSLLVETLRIKAFPTLVLAGPDGKILDNVEGYVAAPRLQETVQRLLAAVPMPADMKRDYQEAVSAVEAADYGQATTFLRRVLEDGKNRPVQAQARRLLQELEQRAATRLERLRELSELGQDVLVLEALPEFARTFAGTQAAVTGTDLAKKLAERPEIKVKLRERQARTLVLQARADFRAKRFLSCLERCDQLAAQFADLAESMEGQELAAAIKDHPEHLRQLCDNLQERRSDVQLLLVESLLKQGRPGDAITLLEQVARQTPGSRPAERARARLEEVQTLFPRD